MRTIEATVMFPTVVSLQIEENESDKIIQEKLKKLGFSIIEDGQVRYDWGIITYCSNTNLIEV